MKRCYEQEETTSIAKRSIVLGCSISIVSAFGETSFITHLVLSPKGLLLGHPCKATMFLTERVVGSSPSGADKIMSGRHLTSMVLVHSYTFLFFLLRIAKTMIRAIITASPTPIRLKMSAECSLVLILSINSELPPTIKITASHTVQRKQTLLFLFFHLSRYPVHLRKQAYSKMILMTFSKLLCSIIPPNTNTTACRTYILFRSSAPGVWR